MVHIQLFKTKFWYFVFKYRRGGLTQGRCASSRVGKSRGDVNICMCLCTFLHLCISYILKGGARGAWTPQTILNFPQKDCLRTRKVSRLNCLQSNWWSFSIFMSSPWNKLSIKTLEHYILNKNATLTPNSCDFYYDLRTFVVAIYALFPQNFGDWKGGIRRLSRF